MDIFIGVQPDGTLQVHQFVNGKKVIRMKGEPWLYDVVLRIPDNTVSQCKTFTVKKEPEEEKSLFAKFFSGFFK
jgi:hypothetical protein